jgi:hypothetical protein
LADLPYLLRNHLRDGVVAIDETERVQGLFIAAEKEPSVRSPSRRLNGSVAEGCDRQPKARDQAFGTPVIFNLAAQLLDRGVDQPRASDNTIGRTLKKTFSNRTSSSNG